MATKMWTNAHITTTDNIVVRGVVAGLTEALRIAGVGYAVTQVAYNNHHPTQAGGVCTHTGECHPSCSTSGHRHRPADGRVAL